MLITENGIVFCPLNQNIEKKNQGVIKALRARKLSATSNHNHTYATDLDINIKQDVDTGKLHFNWEKCLQIYFVKEFMYILVNYHGIVIICMEL